MEVRLGDGKEFKKCYLKNNPKADTKREILLEPFWDNNFSFEIFQKKKKI